MKITSAQQLKILLRNDVLLTALVDYIEITPGAELRAMPGSAIFISDAPSIEGVAAVWFIRVSGLNEDDAYDVLSIIKAKLGGGTISGNRLNFQQLATSDLIEKAETSLRLQKQQNAIDAALQQASQVRDGRDGIDGLRGATGPQGPRGLPGKDGLDGRDGQDLLATETNLEDLKNVEEELHKEKGQVLTWDGTKWTNLFIPRVSSISAAGGGNIAPAIGTNVQWKYHEEIGEAHAREFHTNNSNPTLITTIHVSNFNNSNTDISSLLQGLLPVSAQVYVSKVSEPSSAQLYNITSYIATTSGYELFVSHVDTPGTEAALTPNAIYNFMFLSANPAKGGIGDAPFDNTPYVRYNGTWISLEYALTLISN